MAVSKITFFTRVILVTIGILIFRSNIVSGKEDCDFQALKVCWNYVKKEGEVIPPSPECCDVIKNTNLTCICEHLPPGVCPYISMKKVAYVADYCKNPIGKPCGTCTD